MNFNTLLLGSDDSISFINPFKELVLSVLLNFFFIVSDANPNNASFVCIDS